MKKLKEIKDLMQTSYFTVIIPAAPFYRDVNNAEFVKANKAIEDAFLRQKEKNEEMKSMIVEAYFEVYPEITKESLSVIYDYAEKNSKCRNQIFHEFENISKMYIEIKSAG